MGQSLFDAQPTLTQKEITWVIGLVLGGIGYGALLTLGIGCLVALSHLPRTFKHDRFLSVYVLLVLSINTFLQVWNVRSNTKAIFYTDPDRIPFFYHDWENIFLVALLIPTEGVLVWRCYKVQQVLSSEQSRAVGIWDDICWALPVFLWFVEAVTGTAAVALLKPTEPLFDKAEAASPGLTYFLVTVIIHFILTVFATSNIIIRLLRHRRALIAAFGYQNALAKYSLHISSILIESAAINIPLALLAIVVLLTQAEFGSLLTQVMAPGQCIASILVIYQVAIGKAFSERSTLVIGSRSELPRALDSPQDSRSPFTYNFGRDA